MHPVCSTCEVVAQHACEVAGLGQVAVAAATCHAVGGRVALYSTEFQDSLVGVMGYVGRIPTTAYPILPKSTGSGLSSHRMWYAPPLQAGGMGQSLAWPLR